MNIYVKSSTETNAINKLNKIKEYDDEVIAEYTLSGEYRTLYCLIDKDSDNIIGALEDTLHRLIDNGFSDDDIYQIMCAYIPDEDDWEYLEDEGYTVIDMDFILPGELLSFNKTDY